MKNTAANSKSTRTDSLKIQTKGVQNGISMKDDRSSDWLARQLKEEAYALSRVSDMFQLKQQHANKCDAEFIKRFHESSCDAGGIDDGIKK